MTRLDKIAFMNKWCLKSPVCPYTPEECLCRMPFGDGRGCVPFEKRTDKELDEALAKAEWAEEASEKPDMVNQPNHYMLSDGKDCFDVMIELFGREAVQTYCVINAFTYLWRHARKNGTEDVLKAEYNLAKFKELTNNG